MMMVSFVVGALFFCNSCGKSGDKKSSNTTGDDLEITYWNTMNSSEIKTLESFFEKFSEQNPGIKVKCERISFWQAQSKFEQAAKAGIPPDLLRADRFWIRSFAKDDLIVSIDPNELSDELKDCLPIAKQVVEWNGKIWGLPNSVDCLALFYNKVHFRESGSSVPEDLDSFREVAKKNTDASQGRYGFFMNPSAWYFEPFFKGFGGRYFDSSGMLIIKSDQTLKAMNFLLDLKDSQKVIPPVNLRSDTYNTMMRSFKSGQVSMIMNGPWAIRGVLEDSNFKAKPDQLGVAPVPKGPAGRFSPVGCQSLVIPKGSKHIKEALLLAKFLCSVEVETGFSKSHFGIPARNSLFSDPELRRDPYLSPFLIQLQECQELDSNPDIGKLYQPLEEYLKKVLNGDLSPEYALKDIESQWEKRK